MVLALPTQYIVVSCDQKVNKIDILFTFLPHPHPRGITESNLGRGLPPQVPESEKKPPKGGRESKRENQKEHLKSYPR